MFLTGVNKSCPDAGKYVNVKNLKIEVNSSKQARDLLYQHRIPSNEHDIFNQKEMELKEILVLFKDFEKQEIIPMQIQVWSLEGYAIDKYGIIYIQLRDCI